jgi:hypothetical protein
LSRLSYTGVQLTSVPSLAARRSAPPALQQVLNLYPWPTGPDLGGGEAEGLLLTSESGQLLTASLRIDQSLGSRGSLFLRVAESPSRARESRFNWASGTAGATLGSARGIHDLRFNYSRADLLYSTYGGSAYPYAVLALAGMLPGWVFLPNGAAEYRPPPDTSLSTFPTLAYGTFGISAPGLGQFLSFGGGVAQQNQMELRETFSRPAGRHHWRLGGDYIVLAPSRSPANYAVLGVASSLESMLEGKPLAVLSSQPAPSDRIHQLSWFAQDTFRPHERLSLLYGLSWAITPPTTDAARPPSVSGLWTGSEWRGAYTGDIITAARWPMRYAQVAPRVGIAWRLPFEDLVLRAGGGTFQDTTLGAMVSPINGAPFNSWLLAGGGSGLDTATGPSVGLGAGAGDDVTRFLSGVHRPLRLPTSYQWRLALERAMGGRGVASAAWLGAAGRGLLGHQAYVDAETGVLRRNVALTENSSSYQALQVRYSGSATRSLYGSVSYSWSHSIDDGSQDSSVFLVHPGYRLSEARASSSFDVRHALTAAWSYHAPRLGPSSRLPVWLGGWTWSGMARVRSGFPIDVFLHAQPLGRGFDNAGRPDRVAGAPLWIDDAQVAGRRRLNQAAFGAPAGAAGTLGRNAIAGNGLMQVDMSLRREFRLVGGLSAEVGVNVFNVLNHPAFADPTPYLSSPWFGQSTSMQNLMFGSGSPNTGLPPLFQPGGARSAELSFRVSF